MKATVARRVLTLMCAEAGCVCLFPASALLNLALLLMAEATAGDRGVVAQYLYLLGWSLLSVLGVGLGGHLLLVALRRLQRGD